MILISRAWAIARLRLKKQSLLGEIIFQLFTFILERSEEKKMTLRVNLAKVLEYFNNVIDHDKAKLLHSLCLARSVCHLTNLIDHCHCFLCKICRICLQALFSRKHQELLLIVRRNNCLTISDDFVMLKYLVLDK